MNIDMIAGYFGRYGLGAVFVLVFLEYLNLPGFPAGIIMPLAGIMASGSKSGFAETMIVSTLAGLLGSELLYCLGRFGGGAFNGFVHKHFPKYEDKIEKCMDGIRKRGYVGVFLGKLIPAFRTLVSIPAGMVKLEPVKYTVSSVLGVFVWNFVFVGAGYFFGEAVFNFF